MSETEKESVLKKLERIIQDQEMLIKQLDVLSQEEKLKTVQETFDRILDRVNNSQMSIIEKVNNLQSKLDKIASNYARLNFEQTELKNEITNKTFLQNELSKDLEKLNSFIKSGRSPAKMISAKLNDFAKELFVIGVHQNTLESILEEFKKKLLKEIHKMSIDLLTVAESRPDLSDEQKASLKDKIKQLSNN